MTCQPAFGPLYKRLAYEFSDPTLLNSALTHRSAGSENNERLEFLGDAVLGYVIADELYQRFPEADEGELSRRRASLVKGDTLADIARSLELGDYLHLGPGELKSGGFRRDSILADALEAIIGAICLDSDVGQARTVVGRLFGDHLVSLISKAPLKDPKTRLQEYLQARKLPLPDYQVLQAEGEQHAQTFTVSCEVGDTVVQGVGASRRKAEQAAAAEAIKCLGYE